MLGRAGKGDVAFHAPWSPAGMEGRALILVGILGNAAAAPGLVRLHPIDLLLVDAVGIVDEALRSEENTSELQSLMRISYAGFCLKNKKTVSMNNNSKTQSNTIND